MTSHHITSSERTQVSLETIQWNRPDAKLIVFFFLFSLSVFTAVAGVKWCVIVYSGGAVIEICLGLTGGDMDGPRRS